MLLRNKRLSIGLVLLLLLLTGGGYAYANVYRVDEAETPPVQTAQVRRGSLVVAASGVGTVIPAEEVGLTFQSSGLLVEVLVDVGDEIEAGAVLARLDNSAAQQAVANAELQLAQTRAQNDPAALERTIALAEIEVTQAEINLTTALATLDDMLSWEADPDAIALAEANLAAAQAAYYAAASKDNAGAQSLISPEISLAQAEQVLADAQAEYDNAFDSARDWEPNIDAKRDAAARNLQRAQDNLTIAQANYDIAQANINYSSSTSARTNVLSAEQALVAAQSGPAEDEIETAQIQVQQAELTLRRAEINLEAAADNTLSEISLAQAELNLANAQQALAETTLVAPLAGTVVAVAARPGESVGSAAVITLASLDQPMIELFLDETDLAKVGVGYEVDVIFDALPDYTFTGRIIRVDPSLVNVSNVPTIRAVAQLDAAALAGSQTLPVGLNAAVDVIGSRAENVLLVPVEALRELTPDEYAVFIMEEGEPRLHPVEVGLMDFTFAEIISGLSQGDVVTTGIVETN